MAQQEWVIVAVIVLVLLQLAVYRYLRDRTNGSVVDAHSADASTLYGVAADRADDPGEDRPPDDRPPEEGRHCPACGTVNGVDFTFCRHCVSRLGA